MDKGDMGGLGESSFRGRRDDLVEQLCRAYEPQLLQYLTRMLGRVDVARAPVEEIRRAGQPCGKIGPQAGVAAPETSHGVAKTIVPFAESRRMIA